MFAAVAGMGCKRFRYDLAQACTFPMLACEDVMGLRQRHDPGVEHLLAFAQTRGAAQGLARHRLDGGERVLDPMVEFVHEQGQPLTRGYLVRDIAEITDDAEAPVGLLDAVDLPFIDFDHAAVAPLFDTLGHDERFAGLKRVPEDAHQLLDVLLGPKDGDDLGEVPTNKVGNDAKDLGGCRIDLPDLEIGIDQINAERCLVQQCGELRGAVLQVDFVAFPLGDIARGAGNGLHFAVRAEYRHEDVVVGASTLRAGEWYLAPDGFLGRDNRVDFAVVHVRMPWLVTELETSLSDRLDPGLAPHGEQGVVGVNELVVAVEHVDKVGRV